MKILIIKTSSMGDIIHALPVARDICQALPDAELHWVAEESFRDIPTLAPAVDKVHVTAFRRWRRSLLSSAVRGEVEVLKEALRSERYDVVLDIQGLMRSAMVARWTGVRSTGYSWGTAKEPLASLTYANKLNLPASLGAVRRYRMAAAQVLGYEIDEAHPIFGLRATAVPSISPEGAYAALAVNTSRDEKLWPEEHWIALGRRLCDRGLKSVLFWGSTKERERVERLCAQIPGAQVAPRAGLAETASSLAGATCVVGVDTGLAHLGAALGRPSVGIFVSTPTDTLRLIGDGPVHSLGGVGQCPMVDDVWKSLLNVMGETA
ncbi:MAG: lipopolysaccharide heptosyltransferase I [Sutterella sp.]